MLSDSAKPRGKSNHVGPIDPAPCVHSCITQRDAQIDTRAARIKNISNNWTDGRQRSVGERQTAPKGGGPPTAAFFSLPVGG